MTWVPVREIAAVLRVAETTIERRAERGLYKYEYAPGRGRGGRQLRIALESLPQEAQDRYNGVHPSEDRDKPASAYLHMTDAQREKAAFKHLAVAAYKDFKQEYSGLDKMVAFLERFNAEHPEKPITRRQLNHWETLFDRDGVEGLVDRRGGGNKGSTDIPPEAWDLFRVYWLSEGRPTVESCVEIVADELGMQLPTPATFRRQIKDKIPLMVQDRYRKGKKYYEDHHAPYNPRDYSGYHSNDCWIADHHVFDLAVLDQNGKVVRPWLSAWEDLHSRMIVGYALNFVSPNSDIVLDSFARACYQCGLPDSIKLDNGKDYKAFDLFNTEFSMAVCREMQIEVSFALPYNAKAKPIERLFGTLEKKYCKHFPQYLSNDPKTRPEKMRKRNDQLKQDAMPYEKFKKLVDDLIKTYNTSPNSALKGKTPRDAYAEGFAKPMRVVVGEDALNMFLMRTTKLLKVGRNGIRVPQIGYQFDDEKLYAHRGKSVYVRYNSDDVRTVYVFTESNDFLCIATCIPLCEYSGPVAMEQIRELQRRKKAQNKFLREQMPDVPAQGAAAFLSRKAARWQDFEPDNTLIAFNPVKHRHAAEIQKAEEVLQTKEAVTQAGRSAQRQKQIQEAYHRQMTGG